MTAVVVVAIVIIFVFGMIIGIVLLVSVASHREDKRLRLSREAPDRATQAGRYLTSLYVHRPGDDVAPRRVTDDHQPAEIIRWPNRGPGDAAR